MLVRIKLIDGGRMPVYTRDGDACMDCFANPLEQSITLPGHSRCLVPLGFALQLPDGYECVIRPRSGLTKESIDCAIGTVDPNYRGEVCCEIINNSDGNFTVSRGDRICQIAVRKTEKVEFIQFSSLEPTERGDNGFGSSGK